MVINEGLKLKTDAFVLKRDRDWNAEILGMCCGIFQFLYYVYIYGCFCIIQINECRNFFKFVFLMNVFIRPFTKVLDKLVYLNHLIYAGKSVHLACLVDSHVY